jgi:2-polyprenyl-3-methyl-5-hydroxy-6-metoxy-1,4-benzoquinol methylase
MATAERISAASYIPAWVRHEHAARFEFCADRASGKRVVDCATGTGLGAREFAAAGASFVAALDRSFDALSEARAEGASGAIRLVHGSAGELPFTSHWADLFISLETIEHLEDVPTYLCEVVRVLHDHAIFICSTPNRDVTNPNTTFEDKPFNPFHIREYSVREFEALLLKHFGSVILFGQNPQNRFVLRLVAAIAAISPSAAVRFRQFLKLPALLIDRPRRHAVMPWADCTPFEYVVALCASPRLHSPDASIGG